MAADLMSDPHPEVNADSAPLTAGAAVRHVLGTPRGRVVAAYIGVWLVFVIDPVYGVLRSGGPAWHKMLGLGVIAAFVVIYQTAQVVLLAERVRSWLARPMLVTGTLLGLAVALAPTAGVRAVSLLPFVQMYAALGMSWTGLLVTAGVCYGAVAAVMVTVSPQVWPYFIPLAVTSLVGVFLRYDAQRRQEREEAAAEVAKTAERERVARDVHDILGHTLTVITMKAELAEALVDRDPARAKAELAELRALSRQGLAEIRSTVVGLRVMRLADELRSAHDALATRGIELSVLNDISEIDPRHRITMAWVLREAVTNIARHSGATRAQIRWGSDWIEVADNGKGMRGSKFGSGMSGIQERIDALGGSLHVTGNPQPGMPGQAAPLPGTKLRVTL